MRLLRPVVFLGMVLCVGAMSAPAQQRPAAKLKREPKSLDDTMVWLRESIAQTDGFSLGRERLRYEFHGQDMCSLSWRPVTAGDEELQRDYPGVEQDEELKAIVLESVRVEPMDVRGLLAGGTGQAAAGEAEIYWKITANYMDGRRLPEEPFGFVFADMQTAQRVAAVLERGVGQCQGAKAPPEKESDVGCDSSPTLKVVYEGTPPKTDGLIVRSGKMQMPIEINGRTGQMNIANGRLVNHNDEAVSCVFVLSYYAALSGPWVRDAYVSFDLAAGESVRGNLDVPRYVDASPGSFYHQCFPQGAVNVQQHVCADLNHAVHLVVETEKAKAKH